jgi:glycerol-3-phosphate dehydrogenase (NAD(P)+)
VSRHGRNRRVGERIGQGERPDAVLGGMTMVAEGVHTARSVHQRATQMGVDMPITAEVYRVLYEGKNPRTAVSDLMLRSPKGEEGGT